MSDAEATQRHARSFMRYVVMERPVLDPQTMRHAEDRARTLGQSGISNQENLQDYLCIYRLTPCSVLLLHR